jgi:hypothetical protein
VPKLIIEDDEMPRRRRGAQAVAIDADEERGLAMRLLLHSPKDLVAGGFAAAAICAIVTNALFLQAGRHPSPMFGGSVVTLPAPAPALASPLPRPRPVEAVAKPAEPAPPEPKPVEVRGADTRNSDTRSVDARNVDAMTNLVVKSTSAPASSAAKPAGAATVAPSSVMRPPASIPSRSETTQSTGARRVAAMQRALTQYGYGQLKPTGTIGSDTQAAISKFERDRKLPVTGQMSDRVVKELTAMIGHPID